MKIVFSLVITTCMVVSSCALAPKAANSQPMEQTHKETDQNTNTLGTNASPDLPALSTHIPHTAYSTASAPTQHLPENEGPFLQPDVLTLPQKEDLKETSSSTRLPKGTPGLRVPE